MIAVSPQISLKFIVYSAASSVCLLRAITPPHPAPLCGTPLLEGLNRGKVMPELNTFPES